MAFLMLVLLTLSRTMSSVAQRPPSTSICDFYTPQILGENTASNQQLLMTLLVNTFVIGNYTTPNTGVAVAGIAAPAVYNGTDVELLPYFTGALNSTNLGGNYGGPKLFLDNGGAGPLASNMSSNGDPSSAQYRLLTHIYQYFGGLTGCSLQGASEFPKYLGRTSMYEVHRFMNLDKYQMGFFIQQVHDSAVSLGIQPTDATFLANTLDTSFNKRCAPATGIDRISNQPELQAVCIADNCPEHPQADCAAYPLNGVALVPTNVTATNSSNGDGPATSTTPSAAGPSQTGGGDALHVGSWSDWLITLLMFGVGILL